MMLEANYKVPDGKLVKVKLLASSGKIDDVKILGDFFLHPEDTILSIEEALVNSNLDEKSIEREIEFILKKQEATLIGATPADFAKTIMMAYQSK
jgi:hypothetical protein